MKMCPAGSASPPAAPSLSSPYATSSSVVTADAPPVAPLLRRISEPSTCPLPPTQSPSALCGCGGHHAAALAPIAPLPPRRESTGMPDSRPRRRTEEMVADHRSIQHLFENNKRWRENKSLGDPTFFERTALKQSPRYLWIGCSDSRVPAEEVTGLAPGEMFVHRNVANLVVSNDINSLSVVQFAVEKLRVKDIIVCGHYGCGGVLAAMENKTMGLLDNWLRNIRDVCRLYQPELVTIASEQERFRRIVELNIIEQCLNIFKINMVQRHQLHYGFPRIHGLVYDIRTGELKELDIDFHGYLRKFRGIYRLHAFPTDGIPLTRANLRVNMVRHLADGHEEDEGRVSVRYIRRSLKAERELFEPGEVDDAIEFARRQLTDETTPFIAVEDLVSFFYEEEEEGGDEEPCAHVHALTDAVGSK